MTTTTFAAVHLLLLALFGVARYFSTLSAVSSAFRLMAEQEAKTLLAENPANPTHAILRGGEKKQKLHVKTTSSLGEGREHFERNGGNQPIFCPKCRYKVSSQQSPPFAGGASFAMTPPLANAAFLVLEESESSPLVATTPTTTIAAITATPISFRRFSDTGPP